MPRVHHVKKSTRGNEVHCRKCGKKIEPGEEYIYYSVKTGPRSGRKYTHCKAHPPKPTDLSSSKMAEVTEAVEAAQETIGAATSPEDIEAALTEVKDTADSVREQYEESLSNMPEPLQQGPTGEEIQAKMDALQEFADELENAASDIGAETLPEDEPETRYRIVASDAHKDLAVGLTEYDGYETREEAQTEAEAHLAEFTIEEYTEEPEETREEKLEELKSTAEDALNSLSI